MRLPRIVLALLVVIAAPVGAQTKVPQFALDASGEYVDPNGIWRVVYESTIPINMRYGELKPAQRAALRALYRSMPEDDEPPFPKEGLEPIIRAIIKAQDALHISGAIALRVDVGADGKPTAVSVMRSPDSKMTRFVSTVLLLTDFKPAICRGQPCKMQYPFYLNFQVNQPR